MADHDTAEQRTVDAAALEDLIERHRSIARRLARRYSVGTGIDEDLEQVALTGLFLAATRFDPDQGAFPPFAVATIGGELKKHLRSTGWAVRIPRRLQELSITVDRAAEELEGRLGRSPVPAEIAERVGCSVEDVLAAVGARDARFASAMPPVDPDQPDETGSVDVAAVIGEAATALRPDDVELLRLRFRDEMSQREIAAHLGISQPQVHRRLRSAVERMRGRLDELGFEP